MLKRFCLLLPFIFSGCNSNTPGNSDTLTAPHAGDTARYAVEIPSKAPGSVFKTPVIHFDSASTVHLADFGTHTTITSFGIRDTLGNAITGKEFPENERALVDISMLKPGRYEVNYTAIAEGCTFSLFIK